MNPSSGALTILIRTKPNYTLLIDVQRTYNLPAWEDGIIPYYASDTYQTQLLRLRYVPNPSPIPLRLVADESVFWSTPAPDTYRTRPHWGCGRPRPHNRPAKHGLVSNIQILNPPAPDTYRTQLPMLIDVQRTDNPPTWEDGIA